MSDRTKDDFGIPEVEALEVIDFSAGSEKTRHDQYVEYTHELSEDSAEATSRALVRFVPLAYGGLLGGLNDAVLLGILGGLGLSIAFDLYMGKNSMMRAMARRIGTHLCPMVALLARRLATAMQHRGWAVPSMLKDRHCGAA
ncbi:MAG: hypothetical protein H6958_02245 [Chromatiaceae bacterium]|nr:hypothetical protein [Chromatiaceae bacterium]